MKKITFIFLVFFISLTAHAQLKNTKWKGIIHSDDNINALFDYTTDSLKVTNTDDGSHVETMTYSVKGNVLTIRKVYGQSDCDTTSVGEYKFEIKGNALYLTLLSDPCGDRSSPLNNSKWDKAK